MRFACRFYLFHEYIEKTSFGTSCDAFANMKVSFEQITVPTRLRILGGGQRLMVMNTHGTGMFDET